MGLQAQAGEKRNPDDEPKRVLLERIEAERAEVEGASRRFKVRRRRIRQDTAFASPTEAKR